MERLRFRATSLVDLQAELHERDLRGWSERPHRPPVAAGPPWRLVRLPSLRRRGPDRP